MAKRPYDQEKVQEYEYMLAIAVAAGHNSIDREDLETALLYREAAHKIARDCETETGVDIRYH